MQCTRRRKRVGSSAFAQDVFRFTRVAAGVQYRMDEHGIVLHAVEDSEGEAFGRTTVQFMDDPVNSRQTEKRTHISVDCVPGVFAEVSRLALVEEWRDGDIFRRLWQKPYLTFHSWPSASLAARRWANKASMCCCASPPEIKSVSPASTCRSLSRRTSPCQAGDFR